MDRQPVSQRDLRSIVRLLGEVAQLNGSAVQKKRHLIAGLSGLIEADAWSWIVSRAADDNNNTAVASFLHDGLNPQQLAVLHATMQDRKNTPPEYRRLNELRRTHSHFTRTWDQLVSREVWYGPANRRLLDDMKIEHLMYSVRVLDNRGLFSGIAFKRKLGRQNFTARHRQIVHVILGEVDWLHRDSESRMDQLATKVHPLSPKLRTVLRMLIGSMSIKEIAFRLKLSYHTVNGYAKDIYKHFNVHSRPELINHFISGDSGDSA